MSELVNNSINSMGGSIASAADEVAKYAAKEDLSDQEMIEFNAAASKYSMLMSLTSRLIKTLTDAEQAVAQKM